MAEGEGMTLQELRANRDEILRIAGQRGAYNVRVFGSVARGEATRASDVDFLVDFEPGRSLVDLSGLILDLEEVLGRRVDVGTQVRPVIRDRVERDAVAL
jgi:predicted nucleotidyltransferase